MSRWKLIKGSRAARILMWTVVVILVLLAIPPLQVLGAKFLNPPWSPMQIQRRVEARLESTKLDSRPIVWVPLAQIPRKLIHFIWASEDQAFFQHDGFDFKQLRDSIEQAKKDGGKVRGSSTITMQCARSVFLWQGHSYIRKGLEAYYTFWMELFLSKQRILELYLNHIEWGPGIYGIGSAAQYHFSKPPSKLTNREMISLAAILPNPRKWSAKKPDPTVERKIRRVQRLASRAPFPESQLTKN